MEGVGSEIRPNLYGDDIWNNGVHPLLVDLVLQKVFSFSDVQELLASRSVCRVWGLLATQELRSRDEVVARIGGNADGEEDEVDCMTHFIQVMTPALQSEAGMPLTRIELSIDLLFLVALPTMDLLRFVAPWVQGMRLEWLPSETRSSTDQVSQLIRQLKEGLEGLSFPALRELEVGNFWDRRRPQGLDFVASILVKGLLRGAKGLTVYDHTFRFAADDAHQQMLMSGVIAALPPSLKRLGFWQEARSTQTVDFGVLSNCHFQLEEYLHSIYREFPSSSPKDVLAFLLRQAGTLKKLQMRFLDHLYREVYPTFPIFPLVTRLQTNVSRASRFEWIRKFPVLHQLELHLRCIDTSIDSPEMANPENLPQHQGVRSLGIRPLRAAAMIRFDILRHVFPNLTVLDLTASGCAERELVHLCTHMTELEVLKLAWELHRRVLLVHPDLEAIVCGLPLRVEKGEPAVVDLPVFGLANLKKLRRLDVSGGSAHFELILTPLTLLHAFKRMRKLKEIRLDEIHPQALEVAADIIQVLRTDGIEVKERIFCDEDD